ncbi:MAG: hypothetical protein R8M14_07325 [Ghiorsea sp.]
MARALKPRKNGGAVQPFVPPELEDELILTLQDYLGILDSNMGRATIKIEHALGRYEAEKISLDKKPTPASIMAELTPLTVRVQQLYDALESLSSTTRSTLVRCDPNKDYTSADEEIRNLGRFSALLSITKDELNGKSSRGSGSKLIARGLLMNELAIIYDDYATVNTDDLKRDFISEVLDYFEIDSPAKIPLNTDAQEN